MLDFEPKMTAKIETLLDQWAKRSSAAIDIYPWCHWLGFDTVCKFCYSHLKLLE